MLAEALQLLELSVYITLEYWFYLQLSLCMLLPEVYG